MGDFISTVAALIFFIALIGFVPLCILGLIKIFTHKGPANLKKIFIIDIVLIIVCFILVGVFTDTDTSVETNTEVTTETVTFAEITTETTAATTITTETTTEKALSDEDLNLVRSTLAGKTFKALSTGDRYQFNSDGSGVAMVGNEYRTMKYNIGEIYGLPYIIITTINADGVYDTRQYASSMESMKTGNIKFGTSSLVQTSEAIKPPEVPKITDLEYNVYSSIWIDSVYSIDISFTNNTGKIIKYITFSCDIINAVGDVIYSEDDLLGETTLLKVTGPISPGKNVAYEWEDVWINPTIDHARITAAEIEYTDGTTEYVEF